MANELTRELSEILDASYTALADGNLYLIEKNLRDSQLPAILTDPRVGALKTVNLQINQLGVLGVQTLAKSPKLQTLQSLSLSMNPLRDAGLQALSRAPWLHQLNLLFVASCGGTAAGVRALAAALAGGAIRELAIGGQEVQAAALVELPLESLVLDEARLDGASARALLAHGRMKSLSLFRAPLGAGALVGLHGLAPGLYSLMLDQTELADQDAAALAAGPAPGLEYLSLQYCSLGDDGVRALAQAPWLPQLKALTLAFKGNAIPSQKALDELRRAYGDRPGLSL